MRIGFVIAALVIAVGLWIVGTPAERRWQQAYDACLKARAAENLRDPQWYADPVTWCLD